MAEPLMDEYQQEDVVVLGFKHEDEIDGEPIGPVFDAVLRDGYPYGVTGARPFDPNRQPSPWVTLTEARRLARERGLELHEV